MLLKDYELPSNMLLTILSPKLP